MARLFNESEIAEIEKALPNMKIYEICTVIRMSWANVYFGAKPYISAMASIQDINERFIAEDGRTQVAYFLANATQWKGPVARIVKKELNKRLKAK